MFDKLFKRQQSEVERILELQEENRQLRKQLKQFTDFEHAVKFAIDWEKIRAFSIERTHNGQSHRTVIGHWVSQPKEVGGELVYVDETYEWTLQCSATEHERLVAEFEDHLKRK